MRPISQWLLHCYGILGCGKGRDGRGQLVADLREMYVTVDESGKDQAIFEVRHLKVGVARREVGEMAEVLDDAVPDD